MSNTAVWFPCESRKLNSLIWQFAQPLGFDEYVSLHEWSCENISEFWGLFWDFSKIIGDKHEPILLQTYVKDPAYIFENTRFFPYSKINVAENMLRGQGHHMALMFCNEKGLQRTLSFDQLRAEVSRFMQFLQDQGVSSGDRVAGYIPNMPEAVVAMIATAALGAIWTSCSPDFGVASIYDRFSQTQPKVLITCDGYLYAGKDITLEERVLQIKEKISSITSVVVVQYDSKNSLEAFSAQYPYAWKTSLSSSAGFFSYSSIQDTYVAKPLVFERFPFNHPLLILYSSGTTGKPKCIVHGAGGTLLTHMKEHQLQSDIKPLDRVFYYTTCGWMMWNWLLSALASEASLVLYDGSPFHPSPDVLFEYIEKLGITFFGVSAKYLSALEKQGYTPKSPLLSLKTIASTGSPLLPSSYDYVYNVLKKDVHLMSISGGTDIVSCFLIGHPIGPVFKGELQCAGLGYKIEVYHDEKDESLELLSGGDMKGVPQALHVQGELVCTKPFPSQPLFFWNDFDEQTQEVKEPAPHYHKAYFTKYYNIWHHGDFIEKTENNGFIIHGRSDSVLNPGGVRIGTGEIYRQIEQIPEIIEALAVGQEYQDDIRIVLFVQLKPGITLDDTLITQIKQKIRSETTARHVPSRILQVTDLPRTKNGKLAEIAVRNIIHSMPNHNLASLANPESLDEIQNLCPIL